MDWFELINPFARLGGAALGAMADAWTVAMLGLWNAGLWMLRLVFTLIDWFLTPDLSSSGPMGGIYPYTFWIGGTLVVALLIGGATSPRLSASTGTDAHTVGIDAIMNMKGYAGHYGLERYEMIEAYNLGSQVANEEFVKRATELKADVLLVSQTVTQKDVHVTNLVELVELLEAARLRDKVILIAGGPRINNDLAKELGYDAGFGPGKFAEHVASFFIDEFVKRNKK